MQQRLLSAARKAPPNQTIHLIPPCTVPKNLPTCAFSHITQAKPTPGHGQHSTALRVSLGQLIALPQHEADAHHSPRMLTAVVGECKSG
jgi:hypothetical protein